MPSQRKKAPTSGSKSSDNLKSDEEILKERKSLVAYDTADVYLYFTACGLGALCLAWFIYFSDHAKVGFSVHQGASDPCLILLCCGLFCRGISQATPRLWSWWRVPFHLAWCAVWALIAAVACAGGLKNVANMWLIALISGAFAAAGLMTFPGTSLVGGGKGSSAYLARLALLCDGVVGGVIAVSIFGGTLWSDNLGPLGSALSVLPLGLWSGALCLCCTDPELLVAVPSVMVYYTGASLRSWYFSGLPATIPTAAAVLAHSALYLPVGGDPEANPFYMSLVKFGRRMVKMMSQPVSGFGEDGE